MKRYISFILLIIILFISNGGYLYFKYLQYSIKKEIKMEIRNGLHENNLSIVAVSSDNEDQIEWIKNNEEFRYKGLMYDVVKTELKGNKKIYYCINDFKEKNLITNFTTHSRRRDKILLKFKKVLSNKYFPEFFSINSKINKANIYFAQYQISYKSRFKETSSSPPRFDFNI